MVQRYGKEYWFGFSLRLPDGYTLGTEKPQEEIHFQMHGEPNHALHEAWRESHRSLLHDHWIH